MCYTKLRKEHMSASRSKQKGWSVVKQMNHTGNVNSKKHTDSKRLFKQKRMGLILMLISLALMGVLTGLGMEDATAVILLFPLGAFLFVSRQLWIYPAAGASKPEEKSARPRRVGAPVHLVSSQRTA